MRKSKAAASTTRACRPRLYSSLETLSGLVNISVLHQPDGSVDVTLSSGAALVMGSQSYALTAGNAAATSQSIDPQAPPDIDIQAADGSVVNGQITSGTLAGLLQVRNVTIPGLIGDASQPGALNQLAAPICQRRERDRQSGLRLGRRRGPAASDLFTAPDPNQPIGGRRHHGGQSRHDRQSIAGHRPERRRQRRTAGARGAGQLDPAELGSVGYYRFLRQCGRTGGVPIESRPKAIRPSPRKPWPRRKACARASSGVSLDAEATNVLQFQAGYQAVAKMVSTLADPDAIADRHDPRPLNRALPMTPSINPNSEIFLSNLQQIENRMSTAEQQLSSGLRVSVASDDPDEISSILQIARPNRAACSRRSKTFPM